MPRYRFQQTTKDWFAIFIDELQTIFRDQGILIFFIIVPLGYPLLYTYIYNNETLHEVPAVVVDENRTQESRNFVRKVDATADVHIVSHCANMQEAQQMVKQREAYGIIYIPRSFTSDLARMKQTSVRLYTDMSGLLYYKALLLSCTNVSLEMNAKLKVMRSPGTTDEVDAVTQHPIVYQQVDIFNPQTGFASFLIPAVLILLLQQTLVLGVGLSAGTAREQNTFRFQLRRRHQIQRHRAHRLGQGVGLLPRLSLERFLLPLPRTEILLAPADRGSVGHLAHCPTLPRGLHRLRHDVLRLDTSARNGLYDHRLLFRATPLPIGRQLAQLGNPQLLEGRFVGLPFYLWHQRLREGEHDGGAGH